MSIGLLLEMAADALDDRAAFGSRHGGTTYTELRRLAAGGSAVLLDHGAKSLAIVGVTGPLLPIGIFAAAGAGIPLAPLNYRLSGTALDELLATLEEPLVVADKDFVDGLRREGRQVLSTEEYLAAARTGRAADPVAVDPDSAAVVLFTSGTTSKPKGVILTHGNLMSYVMSTVEFAAAAPEECQLVSVPPYHVAGVGSVLTNVYCGRRVAYLPQFSPEEWLALVEDEAVTSAMVVPTMLSRVTEHLGDRVGAAPSLRSLAYGGARMPRPVLERALRAFPDVGFTNAYGLTETSSTIAVLTPDDHRTALASHDPAATARLGSVGRAVPGVEIAVRGTSGELLPQGQVGEILVRGPQVSGTYAEQGSVLDGDGWFATKDQGHLDDEGYLYIEGRIDDTIIRGGENVAPAEIEDVLIRMTQVRECAVVGVPDDEWGEQILAVVVLEPGHEASTEEVRAFVRAQVRGSRTPDAVWFVEELPYTPTGKLLRRELMAAWAAKEEI